MEVFEMKVRFFAVLASLVVLAGWGSPSRAEEIQFVSAARFASLEQQLAELEARLAGYENGDGKGGKGGVDCGTVIDDCCHTAGWVGSAEMTFLKPTHGEGGFGNYDYQPAPRVAVGYQRTDGLGLRGRWFEYNNNNIGGPGFIDDVEMMTLDLEVTDTFTLGSKWHGVLAGGVRYAEYREEYGAPTSFLDQNGSIGPVIGVEAFRPLGDRLALYGLIRDSILFSEEVVQGFGAGATFRDDDYTFNVLELQVGGEWRRPLCGTGYFFVRSAFEAQFWASVSDDDNEATGLIGGNIAMGVAR